jgi:Xaa-Pro aminopeptidase
MRTASSEYAERREALMQRLPGGVAVFASAPVAIRNNDVEHEYRQESDFYYLTGFDEPEAVLVIASQHPEHRVVLFVRPRDPEREKWEGPRAGVQGALSEMGADAAFPIEELGKRLPDYLANHERLLFRLGRDRSFDDKVLVALDVVRGRGRRGISWPKQIVDPAAIVHEMRVIKSASEVGAMRRAAAITKKAIVAAMACAHPGVHEHEIEAVLRAVFRQNGSARVAFGPTVASGANATVLHYRQNDRLVADGELVLIDAGCEYDYYASDVSRTFPVSGQFTAPQRAVYEVVLDAHVAAIDAARPGVTIDEIHRRAVLVIASGLSRLGLVAADPRKVIDDELYRPFFMHRTSHYLGMDVHDVGSYFVANQPRHLEEGMVITVEPGIYVPAGDERIAPAFRGIGVRIEDEILITASGCENLTLDIPRTVHDVERACAERSVGHPW